ncbi:FecR family protein [Pedobacter sp. JY14-1]|uniref:FecR family protein n=1 Tax=Pedobacter sp. JY14-1 TaxID=3034151 RepID=UPI0023E14922|nr:FecR family protein [Pedobacter sp. JY14-1]
MKEAKELLERYSAGLCTPDEMLLLQKWFHHLGEDEASELTPEDLVSARLRFEQHVAGIVKHPRKLRLWPRIAGVAAAVAMVVFGVWLYKYEVASQATQPRNDVAVNDVAPGNYGATITLANGKTIQLDSAKRGVVVGGAAGLAYSDNTSVISNEERNLLNSKDKGSLGTRDDGTRDDGTRHGGNRDDIAQLIATTARGQTYQFTLPDGTKVWLNADSKLEFPNQFSGKERKILLQGEAYFVVKHNDQQPFRVVSKMPDGKAQVVEDIGTEFNINAYADERSVKTTLVEGAASVSSLLSTSSLRGGTTRQSPLQGEIASKAAHSRNDGSEVLLAPDKQATFSDGKLTVKSVDAIAAVSWRTGVFTYSATPLEEVMRQVARWYNVAVVFEKESLKKAVLGGAAKRSDQLSVILKTLESTGIVKFELEGRKVTVKAY